MADVSPQRAAARLSSVGLATLREVLAAIDAAKAVGCINHLDCWEGAREAWYRPIENARKLVALSERMEALRTRVVEAREAFRRTLDPVGNGSEEAYRLMEAAEAEWDASFAEPE